jgi:hypothetical protein
MPLSNRLMFSENKNLLFTVDNYTSIEDILYYAFCKMLSVCEIYVYKTKVPIPFYSNAEKNILILVEEKKII